MFNDRILHEMEELSNRTKLLKLNNSKTLKLWVKFFSEWFGIEKIELKNAHILKGLPGSPMILVPEIINLGKIFETLKEKCNLETNIQNPDEDVEMPQRRKRGTYLLYEKRKYTLLEECLFFLFSCYRLKEDYKNQNLKFINYLSYSKHKDGTKILLSGFSKKYANSSIDSWTGDYKITIWKGY